MISISPHFNLSYVIPDPLLFNAKPLYLIVDVKEETVVSRTVVAWSHKEAPWSRPDQQVHRLIFAQISVEPGEDSIRVN